MAPAAALAILLFAAANLATLFDVVRTQSTASFFLAASVAHTSVFFLRNPRLLFPSHRRVVNGTQRGAYEHQLPLLPASLDINVSLAECSLLKFSLPLPASLRVLSMRGCMYSTMPTLPAALEILDIRGGAFEELPQLPNSLRVLRASNNRLRGDMLAWLAQSHFDELLLAFNFFWLTQPLADYSIYADVHDYGTDFCPATELLERTPPGQVARGQCVNGWMELDVPASATNSGNNPTPNDDTCGDSPCALGACADMQNSGICAQSSDGADATHPEPDPKHEVPSDAEPDPEPVPKLEPESVESLEEMLQRKSVEALALLLTRVFVAGFVLCIAFVLWTGGDRPRSLFPFEPTVPQRRHLMNSPAHLFRSIGFPVGRVEDVMCLVCI